MTTPDEPDTSRSFGSRLLSAADQWASRPVTGLAVIALVGCWIIISVIAGFPDRLERAFEVLVAALTLAMLSLSSTPRPVCSTRRSANSMSSCTRSLRQMTPWSGWSTAPTPSFAPQAIPIARCASQLPVRMMPRRMRCVRINHGAGVSLSDLRWAILETNGQISFIKQPS